MNDAMRAHPGYSRFILAAVMLPLVLSAQSTGTANYRGSTLIGLVLGDDAAARPIRNASVEIRGIGLKTRSDSAGGYALADIPAGIHVLEVRALGFGPLVARVTFTGNETVQRDFLLTPQPAQSIEGVEVTARVPLSEFEERRRLGKGHFITRSELEKVEYRRVSDVLARLPGLRIRRSRSGAEAFALSSRGLITMQGSNRMCYVHVYVDDVPVFNSVASEGLNKITGTPDGAFNLNSLSIGEIEGVEYYAGGASVPTMYNRTGSACGVLLIWTRR